jgi:hypothetical protein
LEMMWARDDNLADPVCVFRALRLYHT